jgi:hypothetical protein
MLSLKRTVSGIDALDRLDHLQFEREREPVAGSRMRLTVATTSSASSVRP